MKDYLIPADAVEVEYEIKKSRFIARAAYANSRESAMALLEQARVDYPDARHHCYAYLLGHPHSAASAAMSDDGEPSGTAGKPILNVLQHKQIGDVMLVVIRYFGGIKLGAGGLVRAYSAAAQMAMEALPTLQQVPMTEQAVICDFSTEQVIRHWLKQYEGDVIAVEYGHQVIMRISYPSLLLEQWQQFANAHAIICPEIKESTNEHESATSPVIK